MNSQKSLDVTTTSYNSTFTTVINFFTSIPTKISDFFKDFDSDIKEIINSDPLALAAKGAKIILGINQEPRPLLWELAENIK